MDLYPHVSVTSDLDGDEQYATLGFTLGFREEEIRRSAPEVAGLPPFRTPEPPPARVEPAPSDQPPAWWGPAIGRLESALTPERTEAHPAPAEAKPVSEDQAIHTPWGSMSLAALTAILGTLGTIWGVQKVKKVNGRHKEATT